LRRYYAKSKNCCQEIRGILNSGPDGGACPGLEGPCRGAVGGCATLLQQFDAIPVLPGFPNGMQDYECDTFPDDNRPLDSVLVGLIAIAVAFPVTAIISSLFEVANDNDAPEVRMRTSVARACA
jgi:hypothetical protein